MKCKRSRPQETPRRGGGPGRGGQEPSRSSSSSSRSSSSGRLASSRRSYSSSSRSSSSRGAEGRKHYPVFTAEYARRYGGGNFPFLCLDPGGQSTQVHSPLLRLKQLPPTPWVRDRPRWILYNEYVFLRELGKGTYAKVVLCRSLRTGDFCALKIFRNESSYKKAYWDEVGALQALCRPHPEDAQQQQYEVGLCEASQTSGGGGGVVVSAATARCDAFDAAAVCQGRAGRFIVPIAHLPHPVHHAIVLPPLGPSLLDLLRCIREVSLRTEDEAAPAARQRSRAMNGAETAGDALPQRGAIEVHYRGLPLPLLRTVLYQILLFLRHAHRRGIVHTDLKPENVLFESNDTLMTRVCIRRHCYNNTAATSPAFLDPAQRGGVGGGAAASASPAFNAAARAASVSEAVVNVQLPVMNAVRVIDVGAAEFLSNCRQVSALDGVTPVFYHRIHTTHYRSVEVLLGLGWTSSADLWSLGCMIPELLTGDCVFMPRDDLEHLALMQHIVGPFDAAEGGAQAAAAVVGRVFAKGRRFGDYFDTRTMQLAWPQPSTAAASHRRRRSASLEDLRYVASRPTLEEVLGPIPLLHDLCRRMLDYDPLRRITAAEALHHPFFTAPA
ncbi:putative serine/threonine protein kinase [Trypanosoma conorhini]|uniref:Putative serine/threonine protein kinase n=1 Tax=Trypanosoma conorhini TaxID=83891 RepID=A0A3R7PGC3_9TRYP|nr:putative serine/threonine protein kinase [Trypanosoma conorhini]RNF24903.1 putative serine/threonine protein kinase [Trypanosoma conorhini]